MQKFNSNCATRTARSRRVLSACVPAVDAVSAVRSSVARSRPLPESTIHVPTFSPSETVSEALDLLPFSQARSQPSKGSSIHVPPLSPSKTPPALLDVLPFSPARSQPPIEDSIGMEAQNTNLERKVSSEAGGTDSNAQLGPDRLKRQTQKPLWLKDFI
ncbi:Ty3/gypsy retrotransposon protein [Sesbania bispinosa]|nr:Ty3/gypsy retrotransposon protein [Sesbania bispinosa]